MAREICLIFDRAEDKTLGLVGAWMQFPQNLKIVPDEMNFRELLDNGPMAARYFRNEPHREVANSKTDIGRGCIFIGGAFVMGHDHPAPNEKRGEPGREYEYEMRENAGITICIREKKAGPGLSSTKNVDKQWWQFWK